MSADGVGGSDGGRGRLTAWCPSCGRQVILTGSGACPAGHDGSALTDAPPPIDPSPTGRGASVAPWTLQAEDAEAQAEALLDKALAEQAAEERRRNRTVRAALALAISIGLMLLSALTLVTTVGNQYFIGEGSLYPYHPSLYEFYGDHTGYVRFTSGRYAGELGGTEAYLDPRTQVLYHDKRVIDLAGLLTRTQRAGGYAYIPIAMRFARVQRAGTYADQYVASELAIDSPRAHRALAWMETRRYGLVIAGVLAFGMLALWFGRCLLARRFRRPAVWWWVVAGVAVAALAVFAVPATSPRVPERALDQNSSIARARTLLAESYDFGWMASDAYATVTSAPTSTGYLVTFTRPTPDSNITLEMGLGGRGEFLSSTLTSVAVAPARGSSAFHYLNTIQP